MRARDPVPHTVRACCAEGEAQPGARLVRDRVQGQQRYAQLPVPGFSEIAERDSNPGAEGLPLPDQHARDGQVPVLGPGAPLPGRVCDRVGPFREAGWRPVSTRWWGQGEAVGLRALEDHFGQREQIRGPFE